MAFETSLACPRGSREGHSGSPFTPSTPRLVVRRKQCTGGPTFAPSSTRSSAVYRRLKRRLGRTLRGLHCKRRLVSHRKSPSHKLLRTEDSPPGPEEIRASLQGPDCSCCDGQYNSGLLHQQAGRYEVRLSVCPPLEAPILVPSQGNCPEGKTHSRSLECDRGQAFQTQPSDPDRVVPISTGVQSFVFQMGPTTGRLVCNPLLTPWAQWGSILLKALTLTGYLLVFTGIIPKIQGIFQSGTFLLFLMSSQKHPLSL